MAKGSVVSILKWVYGIYCRIFPHLILVCHIMLSKIFLSYLFYAVLFLWITKPPLKIHNIFLVQLRSLLLKMEASSHCSNLCLLILENYLLHASGSKLILYPLSGLFLCQALFWHFLAHSFKSFCLLTHLCLVPYHSLVPTWGAVFLPKHLNLLGVFPWRHLLTYYLIFPCVAFHKAPCCPLLAVTLGCHRAYFSF